MSQAVLEKKNMEEDQEDEATANCKQRLWLKRLAWMQKQRHHWNWMEISH